MKICVNDLRLWYVKLEVYIDIDQSKHDTNNNYIKKNYSNTIQLLIE